MVVVVVIMVVVMMMLNLLLLLLLLLMKMLLMLNTFALVILSVKPTMNPPSSSRFNGRCSAHDRLQPQKKRVKTRECGPQQKRAKPTAPELHEVIQQRWPGPLGRCEREKRRGGEKGKDGLKEGGGGGAVDQSSL